MVPLYRVATPPASAADRAAQLSAELMSPYCPGRTLATCPSGAADDLQREILNRLEAGETEERIADALADRFGGTLRGAPEARGSALALWIVPGLLGLAMMAVLVTASGLTRHLRRANADVTAAPVDEKLSAQLDEELEQLG
jgi:cytochrome c-type biogenesis protein CcmH/NrfF